MTKELINDSFKKAKWIGLNNIEEVLEFKKIFNVDIKNIKEATLVISGLGFFNAYLNSLSLDNYYFKPEMTDYKSRKMNKEEHLFNANKYSYSYLSYDLLKFLKEGENELQVYLANGYYQNTDRPYEPFRGSYGDKCLRFSIIIVYKDKVEVILSDESTKVRRTRLKCGLYRGNHLDFSKDKEPFNNSLLIAGPNELGTLQKSPLDVSNIIKPIKIERRKDSLFLDFGINHSGGIHFLIKGKKGQVIKVGHTETIKENGELNYETSHYEEVDPNDHKKVLDSIDQISEYTLSGSFDEIKPTFSWFCYRYVEIKGIQEAEIKDIYSLFIHANIKERTKFSSSIPFFEEIDKKAKLTILDNAHAGLITDCPHREKRPYTGDGSLVEETALYAFDCESLYSKWLQDIINSQTENGFIPYTAPHLAGGGGFAWSYAIAIVPYLLFTTTGKISYVKRSYKAIKKWLDFCSSCLEDGIIKGNGISFLWCLSDWSTPNNAEFNVPYMSSACYYQSLNIAIFFAKILNKNNDLNDFENRRKILKDNINSHFYNSKTFSYCKSKQGEDALAIAFNFYPEKDKKEILTNIRRIYEKEKHFDTGMVMTPLLLDVLFENNMSDIALTLLTQKDYPSYYDMLEGETTIPETWSKHQNSFSINGKVIIDGGNEISHCHPMFASVVSRFYKYIAGIDLSNLYKKEIIFSPKATKYLDSAYLEIQLKEGKTVIDWKKEKGKLKTTIIVPKGFKGIYKNNILSSNTYMFGEEIR